MLLEVIWEGVVQKIKSRWRAGEMGCSAAQKDIGSYYNVKRAKKCCHIQSLNVDPSKAYESPAG